MSRSAEAAAAGVLLASLAMTATAAPDIVGPGDLPEPQAFPVIDLKSPQVGLTPPVVDLSSVTEDLKGAAQIAESNSKVAATLDANIAFTKDSDAIQPIAKNRLNQIAAVLKQRGPGRVQVVGHTDDLGSAQHGRDLSQRRAAAVHRVLAPQLPGFTITAEGKGEDQPKVPNKDEASRAKNRRVEITYTKN